MLPDPNFPQANVLYTYSPGFDLPVFRDEIQEVEGEPPATRVISKWKLSKEDIEFINDKGYIYLSIIGGQPPVCLIAEEIFTEP